MAKKLIEFNVSATLKIDSKKQVVFPKAIEYSTSDNVFVSISNNKDDEGEIDILLKIKTGNSDLARAVAEIELKKIANVLSFEAMILIKDASITYIQNSVTGKRKYIMSLEAGGYNVKFPEVKLDDLSNKFTSYDDSAEDVLIMWREALAEKSEAGKFLLYFRLLEYLCGSRVKADQYIRRKKPDVKLGKGKNGEDISTYTYLRDNIHKKKQGKPEFPYKEIQKQLPSFVAIVKNAVEERLVHKL